MEKVSFVVACKKFFGLREGQKLSDFIQELKRLTEQDKADLKAMFPSVGYEISEEFTQ
jgi:hypothetical protein